MNHIRQAVILAAGMGSRLKGTIEEKPKGFLQFGNKSIIEESITGPGILSNNAVVWKMKTFMERLEYRRKIKLYWTGDRQMYKLAL